jgi:N-acetylmuramoyl-L-alanine amidase
MRRRSLLLTGIAWGFARTALAAPVPVLHRDFVVVLDAGHGGSNHGCSSDLLGVEEKHLTLRVAKAVAALVRLNVPGARVVMTRTRDEDVPLSERIATANEARADLFVSVHVNASPRKDQSGYETFVLDLESSKQEVARTARRQAATPTSTLGARGDASLMIRELELRANFNKATRVAYAIQQSMRRHFPSREDRGVRQGAFDVLRGLEMPGVLTEVGFLDHAGEGPWLVQTEALEVIAQSIFGGVMQFYKEHAHLG